MDSKRDLDLVLIHPGSRTQIYQSLGSSLSAIEPPVWASLMATFVRRRGFSVADQHDLVARRSRREQGIHEVLRVVTDAGPLGGAGADLDG